MSCCQNISNVANDNAIITFLVGKGAVGSSAQYPIVSFPLKISCCASADEKKIIDREGDDRDISDR